MGWDSERDQEERSYIYIPSRQQCLLFWQPPVADSSMSELVQAGLSWSTFTTAGGCHLHTNTHSPLTLSLSLPHTLPLTLSPSSHSLSLTLSLPHTLPLHSPPHLSLPHTLPHLTISTSCPAAVFMCWSAPFTRRNLATPTRPPWAATCSAV